MADLGYSLDGTMSVSLEINDQQIPPVQGILKSYHIQAGFGIPVPYARISFSDTQKVLTGDLSINDGTKITLLLGKNGLTKKFVFIVVTKTAVENPNGQEIDVIASLSVPAYVYGAQSESFRGTSVEAIEHLVRKSKIDFKSDVKTNDSMTWLNVGKSRSNFVSDIIRHSYINDNTALVGLFDLNNTFVCADIFKRVQDEPEYTVFYGLTTEYKTAEEKTFMASEIQAKQLSGVTNALLNYGTVRVDNGLSGKIDKQKKITPPVLGDGLPINQEVRDSIEYTRMDYAAYHDPGVGELAASNAHKTYHASPNRNDRYLALFNQGIYVLIDGEAEIPLLSCVDFKSFKQVGVETIADTSISGKYIVGGTTLIGNGHFYSERYALYRCYVSDSGNTPVLGSKNETDTGGKPRANAMESSSVDFDDPRNVNAMSKQANPNIEMKGDPDSQSSADVRSAFDKTIDKANSQVDALADKFKADSNGMNLDFLSTKYGPYSDKLDALMREVGAAKQLLSYCKKPSWLELAALDFARLNVGSIFKALSSRIDQVDDLKNSILKSVNALVTSGAIKTNLTSPQLKTNCKDLNTDHINAAIDEKFPDKCLDMNAADSLGFSLRVLDLLRRKLEEFLRDTICLMEK